MTDLAIIGAGPAGLTAAIYGLRAGLTAVVLDKGFYGGQVAITAEVENYPAIARITGPDLANALYQQAVDLGAQVRFDQAEKVELQGEVKTIVTPSDIIKARAVIIANGAKRRRLGCEGEARLEGKGVSYCATCDGAFFRGKDVILVGGGNTALEDALFLANNCRQVTIVHRRGTFRGEKRLALAVSERSNIRILFHHTVERIEGERVVTGALLRNRQTGSEQLVPAEAVFIAIGYEPDNTLFAGQLPMDGSGYLVADESCATPLPGVFVAGDCRTKMLRQIITAAADGAVAAFQAANYCNMHENAANEPLHTKS